MEVICVIFCAIQIILQSVRLYREVNYHPRSMRSVKNTYSLNQLPLGLRGRGHFCLADDLQDGCDHWEQILKQGCRHSGFEFSGIHEVVCTQS